MKIWKDYKIRQSVWNIAKSVHTDFHVWNQRIYSIQTIIETAFYLNACFIETWVDVKDRNMWSGDLFRVASK